jgi:hypothetical protein
MLVARGKGGRGCDYDEYIVWSGAYGMYRALNIQQTAKSITKQHTLLAHLH